MKKSIVMALFATAFALSLTSCGEAPTNEVSGVSDVLGEPLVTEGNKVESGEAISDGEKQPDEDVVYVKVKQICYNPDGSYGSTISWEYDERGFVNKEIVSYIGEDNQTFTFWYDEICDDDGNIIDDRYMTDAGLAQYWINKYDEHNNRIESITYGPDDNIMFVEKSTYEYDDAGRKIKESTEQKQNGFDFGMAIEISYTYDEDGKLLSTLNTYGAENIYEYDDNGYLIKITTKSSGSEVVTLYTNDDKGNLIKEEYFNLDGSPNGYSEYEYAPAK